MNDDKTRENIEKYGWESIYVFDENGDREGFLYTIGLEESYQHPEIMIFGLPREVMHRIASSVVSDVSAGFSATEGKKTVGILAGDYPVVFKNVKENFHSEWLGHAKRYYQKPFRALVMFWPDKDGVFPFEPGCRVDKQDDALGIV